MKPLPAHVRVSARPNVVNTRLHRASLSPSSPSPKPIVQNQRARRRLSSVVKSARTFGVERSEAASDQLIGVLHISEGPQRHAEMTHAEPTQCLLRLLCGVCSRMLQTVDSVQMDVWRNLHRKLCRRSRLPFLCVRACAFSCSRWHLRVSTCCPQKAISARVGVLTGSCALNGRRQARRYTRKCRCPLCVRSGVNWPCAQAYALSQLAFGSCFNMGLCFCDSVWPTCSRLPSLL
eukprot:4770594-Pleurochrysis_carterae.AAC.3